MRKLGTILSVFLMSTAAFAGTPVITTPIPTLQEWGVIILMVTLVIVGVTAIKNVFSKKGSEVENQV